jgi:hypothetical protein
MQFGYGFGSGFPHRLQKRSAGLAFAPHFVQLVTGIVELVEGVCAGSDRGLGAGGFFFGIAEGADFPDIAPTSHNAAPSTITAMLRTGVPPPKRLKIRSCIPNAGRMSDTIPHHNQHRAPLLEFRFHGISCLSAHLIDSRQS